MPRVKTMYAYTCKECGKVFENEDKRGMKFCSLSCRIKNKANPPIEKTCKECGNKFIAPPSANKKYCSYKCSRVYLSKHHKAPHLSEYNKNHNQSRMTPEVRTKIRYSHLGVGECKNYVKYYGELEHRVVASWMLGRPLTDEEVVHHIDENRRNNSPSNLIVFANSSEHIKHHALMRQDNK